MTRNVDDALGRVERLLRGNLASQSKRKDEQTWTGQSMAEWKTRGYVPDSDDEDEDEGEDEVKSHFSRPETVLAQARAGVVATPDTENEPSSEPARDHGPPSAGSLAGSNVLAGETVPPRPSAHTTADKLQAELESGLQTIQGVLNSPRTPRRNAIPGRSASSSPLSSIGSILGLSSPDPDSVLENTASHGDNIPITDQYLMENARLQRAGRELRQRNPIQIHPYALEQAMYQQIWKARGLQPVRVPIGTVNRSEDAREAESQGLDTFNSSEPRGSPSPISSQDISQSPIRGGRLQLPRLDDEEVDDLPEVSAILRGEFGVVTKGLRQKTRRVRRPLSAAREMRPPRFHSYDLPPEHFGVADPMDIAFDVPLSPPLSGSVVFGPANVGPDQMAGRDVTSKGLPTPVLSSSVQQKRSATELSTSPESSEDSDAERNSTSLHTLSTEKLSGNGLQIIRKKIKGVLPASWLKLDLKKQVSLKGRRESSLSPVKAADARGVAQRTSMKRPSLVFDEQLLDDFGSGEELLDEDVAMNSPDHLTLGNARYDSDDDGLPNLWMDDIIEDNQVDTMATTGTRERSRQVYRRRQTRIDEKWPDLTGVGSRSRNGHVAEDAVKVTSRSGKRTSTKRKSKRQRRDPALPQLSILDAPGFAQLPSSQQPRFLRVASRRARTKTTAFHQDPQRKYFRLASKADTTDVNESLDTWRAKPIKRAGAQKLDRVNEGSAISRFAAETLTHHSKAKVSSVADLTFLKTTTDSTLQTIGTRPQANSGSSSSSRRGAQLASLSSAPPSAVQSILASRRARPNRSGAGSLLKPTIVPRPAEFGLPNDAIDNRALLVPRKIILNRARTKLFAPTSSSTFPDAKTSTVASPYDEISTTPLTLRIARKSHPKRYVAAEQPTVPRDHKCPEVANNIRIANIDLTSSPAERITSAGFQTAIERSMNMQPLVRGTACTKDTLLGRGVLSQTIKQMHDTTTANPVSIVHDINTGVGHMWHEWSDTVAQELGSVFEGLQTQLENELMSPRRDEPPPTTPEATDFDRCLECMDAIIRFFNGQPRFYNGAEQTEFLSTTLVRVESLLSRLQTINPIAGGYAHCRMIHALNRLVVMTYQMLSLATPGDVDHAIGYQAQKAVDTSINLSFSTTLFLDDQQNVFEALEENRDPCGTIHIGKNRPGVDTVVIIKHICEVLYPEAWPATFNRFLVKTIEGTNHASPAQYLATLMSVLPCILPLLELSAEGTLINEVSEPKYDGWSFLVPAVDGCLRQFLAFKDVRTRLSRSFGLNVLGWLYRLVKDWGWEKPEALAKILIRSYNANNMKELFNDPMKDCKTSVDELISDLGAITVRELDNINDSDFQVCLKLISLILLQKTSSEGNSINSDRRAAERMRSFVFSLCPNIGPTLGIYQSVKPQDLGSLINRCSLYLVLYCGAPDGCKPRLPQIQNLVNMEESHRSVWEAMLHTWRILIQYHVNSGLDSTSLDGLSCWIQGMVKQMVNLHKLAHDEVIRDVAAAGLTMDRGAQTVIDENQAVVSGFLITIFACWRNALSSCHSEDEAEHLMTGGETYDLTWLCRASSGFSDEVAVSVLQVIRAYLARARASTVLDYAVTRVHSLRALLLNRMQSKSCSSNEFLEELIGCWHLVAEKLIEARLKNWDDYLDTHGSLSWERLSDMEISKGYQVYFMAKYIEYDPTRYLRDKAGHLGYWLGRLMTPGEHFRFEHFLTQAMLLADDTHLIDWAVYGQSNKSGLSSVNLGFVRDMAKLIVSRAVQKLEDYELECPLTLARADTLTPRPGMLSVPPIQRTIRIFTDAMKGVWRSLTADPVKQAEYTQLIHFVLQEIELHAPQCTIDPWFLQQLPPLPDQVLDMFRLRHVPLPEQGSEEMVNRFQRTIEDALFEGTFPQLMANLVVAFSSYLPEARYDIALQTRFTQNVLAAYVQMAFKPPGHILAGPIIDGLACIVQSKMCGSTKAELVLFAKSTFHLVIVARKCLEDMDPFSFHASPTLRPVFASLLRFLYLAFARFQTINRGINSKLIQRVNNVLREHARYLYLYAWSAVSWSPGASDFSPVARGVCDTVEEMTVMLQAHDALAEKDDVATLSRLNETDRQVWIHANSNLGSLLGRWVQLDDVHWRREGTIYSDIHGAEAAEIQRMEEDAFGFMKGTAEYITGEPFITWEEVANRCL